MPKVAGLEVVFPDDTLNQILHAAWMGGLLQFPIDETLLGDVDLSSFGVENLSMAVSGWLPPLATDCGPDGSTTLWIGDLRIDGTLDLFSTPMTLIIYVAFEAPITLQANEGEIEIVIDAIENVELEVSVVEESLVASEQVIADLLAEELVPALGGLLGGGEPLASFPLPEIDLSTDLGLEPGTLLISIESFSRPAWEDRMVGNTSVYGWLR